MTLHHRNLVTLEDLSCEEIVSILDRAQSLKEGPQRRSLSGKVMASCFFEPSTRTRLSFEAAMKRLGGEVIGFADAKTSSSTKGETLADAVCVIGSYADLVVVRHPEQGAALTASKATKTPVINAGDGAGRHPTQTLLDLFTIRECQGKLEDLSIILAGDLLYGRTAHSLALAASRFGLRLFFVSPESLQMPDSIVETLRVRGTLFSFHSSLDEVIQRADLLYMTRLQKERLPKGSDEMSPFQVTLSLLSKAQPHLRVLHPLPRVDEIDHAVDATPFAQYFEQAENGLYVRQALLEMILEDV